MKKHNATTAAIHAKRDRQRAILALADYASIELDVATSVVDSLAKGEAFAIGNEAMAWREVPTAAGEARQ